MVWSLSGYYYYESERRLGWLALLPCCLVKTTSIFLNISHRIDASCCMLTNETRGGKKKSKKKKKKKKKKGDQVL